MTVLTMEDGFYPALGTPTDTEGKLIADSYNKEIELMVNAGAKGVLCMGSMGKMASIKDSEYPVIAGQCVESVMRRIPVMVGVMDCSVTRVIDRIEALGNIEIDGVVATAPYYYKLSTNEMVSFFRLLAKRSKYPVYVYDLPSVTQSPITFAIMEALADIPNIKGLKTANLGLILEMQRKYYRNNDFSVFFSGLDMFDIALGYGINKNLDGMFTCTPNNTKSIYNNISKTNSGEIKNSLNNITRLRDVFLKETVFSAYSYAMGLLGCPGNYQPDYDVPISDSLKSEIYNVMKEINEI